MAALTSGSSFLELLCKSMTSKNYKMLVFERRVGGLGEFKIAY
jgi:hypothetical protein